MYCLNDHSRSSIMTVRYCVGGNSVIIKNDTIYTISELFNEMIIRLRESDVNVLRGVIVSLVKDLYNESIKPVPSNINL
jgi:hypothetical protein